MLVAQHLRPRALSFLLPMRQHLSKSCIGEMAVVRTMSVSVFARDRAHCSDDMGVNNTARFTSWHREHYAFCRLV
jgi:hypothetical protein